MLIENIWPITYLKKEPNNWAKDVKEYCLQHRSELGITPTKQGGDAYDAFRHTYIQMRMTQKYGYNIAKLIGDNHEDFKENNPYQKRQDLFNNEIARRRTLEILKSNNETNPVKNLIKNIHHDKEIKDQFLKEAAKLIKEKKVITDPYKDKRDLKDLKTKNNITKTDKLTGQAASVSQNKPQIPVIPTVNYDVTQRISTNGTKVQTLGGYSTSFAPQQQSNQIDDPALGKTNDQRIAEVLYSNNYRPTDYGKYYDGIPSSSNEDSTYYSYETSESWHYNEKTKQFEVVVQENRQEIQNPPTTMVDSTVVGNVVGGIISSILGTILSIFSGW